MSFDQQRVTFYWMGLRLFSRSFSQLKRGHGKEQPKQPSKARPKKEKHTAGLFQLFYIVRVPHKLYAIQQISRWFFLRTNLRARLGFDDPNTTGQVQGALSMVRAVFPSLGQGVTFDYIEPVFEGRLNISMLIWLPRIAVGIVGFLLSREGRAALRHYRGRPKPARVIA